jgi:hypothetical protein
MQSYQQRVVDEKTELDEKIGALTDFTEGRIFSSLNSVEQSRLLIQLHHMDCYSVILGQRIAAFPPPTQTIVP